MKWFPATAMAAVALCAWGAPQKAKKPADATIVQAEARRAPERIEVDARVRATGEKPLHGLVLLFDLLSPEGGVVATVNLTVDDETLTAGDERSCRAEASEHVRAVKFRIRAFDTNQRELRLDNTGPFPIE
jgi:hypothetical protein